ncbi:MAG: GTP pyrophosphokinase family protein [Oscillospiraceae bacterium]|nr:GTP pyrophosphokinase family protein [Oscillospiraceae bacterium]
MGSIYGKYEEYLRQVCDDLRQKVESYSSAEYRKSGTHISEHIDIRIKSDVSMREKCRKKGLEETAENALSTISDSIGMRIVCSFTDDIYKNISYIRSMEGCTVIKEKDYITHAKPNGYRSYHMIISLEEPFEDVFGNVPGRYKAEIQLRTIAMDSWAALEHKMRYKKDIKNQLLIESELKRVADELASCDLSMQTIRDLIERA